MTRRGVARPPVPFRLKLTLLGAALAVAPLIVVGWLLLDVNADTVRKGGRPEGIGPKYGRPLPQRCS